MHARWLVEIATLFVVQSDHGYAVINGAQSTAAHRYWSISRQRFDRWQDQLSFLQEELKLAGTSSRLKLWQEIRPTFEEILLSDVLTRVLAAIGAQLESVGIDSDMGPITHNVYMTHEDIRNRCLRLLIIPGTPVEQSAQLNQIRFSLEHWNDTFLAQLNPGDTALRYSFKSDRTRELMEEASERASDQSRFVAWQLMTASCQKWMAKNCFSTSAHPKLNQLIGEATLAMLHPERFPMLSPFPGLTKDRMNSLIDQADLWVSKLLYSESV